MCASKIKPPLIYRGRIFVDPERQRKTGIYQIRRIGQLQPVIDAIELYGVAADAGGAKDGRAAAVNGRVACGGSGIGGLGSSGGFIELPMDQKFALGSGCYNANCRQNQY